MHTKATSSRRSRTHQNEFLRRQASLRKVVLGREAVRDRRDAKRDDASGDGSSVNNHDGRHPASSAASDSGSESDTSDVTPWPEFDDSNDGSNEDDSALLASSGTTTGQSEPPAPAGVTSPPTSYELTTTTDEDDALHMSQSKASSFRPNLSIPSGLDSFFAKRNTASKRRPSQIARPPLSYTAVGLSTTSVSSTDADDYGETEMWGWVVLAVTWFVFVTGVGSCFGVWSWAWDVGTTPYAPPEFEDDPTLPIVGYYPALMVLTGVMAWIWVMVAWVGMKYFRHAKITGD
ncbi:hypothetical protein VUR80DRAFT_4560 [Thermomyces stellatus]